MFALCGMNCKVCYKHCYHKKPCDGCLNSDKGKPEHCRKCKIKYLYNLFSVLTYPVTKGFATYQSYTCVEFVIHVLSQIGFKFSAPGYYYKPDDLFTIFKDNIYFEGNLLDYCPDERIDEQYFAPMSFEVAKKSAKCFSKIIGSSIFCRGDNYFKNNKEMFWNKNIFR